MTIKSNLARMNVILLAAIGANAAQAEPAKPGALEEVIVTAQKRAESVQDTPISMAAFTNTMLERQGITNLADIKDKVPNLQLTPHPNSNATTRVFMRGVGSNDDQITIDPGVAIYVDGVYMARNQGMAMEIADIERIEVLRGPQGSLYGRNATGGAINFYTREPDLDRWGFRQDFSMGNRNLFRTRTSVNAPVGDRSAIELTYLKHEQEGYVKNRGTGESRFGDQDRQAWRVAALWEPSQAVKVRYSYDHSEIDDTPAYLAQVPFYPDQGRRPSHGHPAVRDLQSNDIAARGHNLTVDWEVAENLTIKSITGYRKLSNETYQDYLSGALGPAPLFISEWDQDQDQMTQEFQVIGDAFDGQLKFIGGVYYFDESADSLDINTRPLANARSERAISVENTAKAVFGQASWTPPVLDNRLEMTFGARWSEDRRKARMMSGTGLAVGDNKFNDVSPSFVVSYNLTDDVNIYAKAVTGYKTGGFSIRASSLERFAEGFDQENLISYEVGLKSQLLNQRLRINAAIFRSDYDDIQLEVPDPDNVTRSDIINAGEAVIEGAELDVTALLTDQLTLSFSYGYLSTDYKKVKDSSGADVSGNYHFVSVPDHSYNIDLEYRAPVTPLGELTASVGYSWQDEQFGSQSNDPRFRLDSYGLLNARLALSDIRVANGELRVAVWGRNIEDKNYYASHFNVGVPVAIYGQPRSYGVDFTYEY